MAKYCGCKHEKNNAIKKHRKIFPFNFRFITTNIRNELDYSPQTIYWLGGRFESNKYLKWNDGSNITFKVSKSVLVLINSNDMHMCVLKICMKTLQKKGLDTRTTTCRENIKRSIVSWFTGN